MHIFAAYLHTKSIYRELKKNKLKEFNIIFIGETGAYINFKILYVTLGTISITFCISLAAFKFLIVLAVTVCLWKFPETFTTMK